MDWPCPLCSPASRCPALQSRPSPAAANVTTAPRQISAQAAPPAAGDWAYNAWAYTSTPASAYVTPVKSQGR